MRNYTRVLGIFNVLGAVIAASVLVYIFLDSDRLEDRIIVFCLMIPVYTTLHFLFRYRLGFLDANVSKNKLDVLLLRSAYAIFILLFISLTTLFSITLFERNKQNKLVAENSKVKKWDTDTTAYGLTASLQTRYSQAQIQYKIKIKADSTNNYKLNNIVRYGLRLKDKDDFLIQEIMITSFNRNVGDNGVLKGHEINSSSYVSVEDYALFKKWDLIIYNE